MLRFEVVTLYANRPTIRNEKPFCQCKRRRCHFVMLLMSIISDCVDSIQVIRCNSDQAMLINTVRTTIGTKYDHNDGDTSATSILTFRCLPRDYGIPSFSLGFWAVRPLLSDRCPVGPVCPVCLSVTLAYCGQTAGWIRMPLDVEVGLDPGDIVLDWDLALPAAEMGTETPYFPAHVYGRPSQQLRSSCCFSVCSGRELVEISGWRFYRRMGFT